MSTLEGILHGITAFSNTFLGVPCYRDASQGLHQGEIGNETLRLVHGVDGFRISRRVSGVRNRLRLASALRRLQRHVHDKLRPCSGSPRLCLRANRLCSA